MSNVNFIVKASRPIQDCSTRTQLRSCVSIDVEHDQCDGITLWLNGVDGNTGIPEVFKIPDFNWKPKSIDQWDKENLFKSLIIENMSGNTVHQYRFKGSDVVEKPIEEDLWEQPVFYIIKTGTIVVHYNVVIVYRDKTKQIFKLVDNNYKLGCWEETQDDVEIDDKVWIGPCNISRDDTVCDILTMSSKTILHHEGECVTEMCVMDEMSLDGYAIPKTIYLRMSCSSGVYYFNDRDGNNDTHSFQLISEDAWGKRYSTILNIFEDPKTHSNHYLKKWIILNNINQTINFRVDPNNRSSLTHIFDLALKHFKSIDGEKNPSTKISENNEADIAKVYYEYDRQALKHHDNKLPSAYVIIDYEGKKEAITYGLFVDGDFNSTWIRLLPTSGGIVGTVRSVIMSHNRNSWIERPGKENIMLYPFDIYSDIKHNATYKLLSECIDFSGFPPLNSINFG